LDIEVRPALAAVTLPIFLEEMGSPVFCDLAGGLASASPLDQEPWTLVPIVGQIALPVGITPSLSIMLPVERCGGPSSRLGWEGGPVSANKILLVDDEPFVRILLEEALGSLVPKGAELLIATNGIEALQLVELHHPRLVVLDVMMPKVDGLEVCRRIRANPAFTDIYILLLTARGLSVDRLRGFEAGADEYVSKPFDPTYLVSRAAELLGIKG
jgi:two-component system, OmpR family, alkaline phosphatase synthesis response regulator PhoP